METTVYRVPVARQKFGNPSSSRSSVKFGAALLKVASRCNLDCDYCYVYKHLDQTWRAQPKLMSSSTLDAFAQRLGEYVEEEDLGAFSVIFHGGEPLLFRADRLAEAARTVRAAVPPSCDLDFSLQTNGVLLDEGALRTLTDAGVTVSLSLDGPRHVHDRHRPDHGGRSTFDATMAALSRLQAAGGDIFRGVIAVIDPSVSPRELFEFFAPMELPRLDILLPDATHAAQPTGRANDGDLYVRWLREAFRLWFEEFSALPLRWFDAVLASRVGVPSPTDVMGFGAVTLVVVETDGTYSDHDVFKVASKRGGLLTGTVHDRPLAEVAQDPSVLEHNRLLTPDGVAEECQTCPVVEACGGGCVMHRAHPERGFDAPTVYCGEMFGLLSTASRLLRSSFADAGQASGPDDPFPFEGRALVEACRQWRLETDENAERLASALGVSHGGSAAALLLPTAYGLDARPAAGDVRDAGHWLGRIRLHAQDPRLASPFVDTVRVLASEDAGVAHALRSLNAVETCLASCDPDLTAALSALITDIVFVESTAPDEGGIFSFSDDKAPNVLYVAPLAGGIPLPPEDLADSIYHEFLHQVLYHYERGGALLFDRAHPKFPAPWRSGLRPAGGFLHGTFVFAGLSKLWAALGIAGLASSAEKGRANSNRAREQAAYGAACLRDFALLTPRGEQLVEDLIASIGLEAGILVPPGVLA